MSRWIENRGAANLECAQLLRMLLDKRPPNPKDSRIFLTPNPSWNKHEDSQWYKIQPIGVNTIGKWTKEAAEKMGITKKITNQGQRATAASHAVQQVSPQEATKITAHASTSSLTSYVELQPDRRAKIGDAMLGIEPPKRKVARIEEQQSRKTRKIAQSPGGLQITGGTFSRCTIKTCVHSEQTEEEFSSSCFK